MRTAHCVRRRGFIATLIRMAFLCLAGLGVAAAGQKAEAGRSQPTPYAELVERYRKGDLAGAVTGLAAYDDEGLTALRESWFRGVEAEVGAFIVPVPVSAAPPPELLLAAMLHTDCAFALLRSEQPGLRSTVADRNLELADELLDAHDHRVRELGVSPAAGASFHRRWHLAVAIFLHRANVTLVPPRQGRRVIRGANPPSMAEKWIERGLRHFSGDAALLLEAGVGEERAALFPPFRVWLADQDDANRQDDSQRRRRALDQSRERFASARAADPGLAEARLRLARVQAELEASRRPMAIAELEAVLAGRPGPELAYLANLFLGDLHERADESDAAETCYRAAVALVPEAQAARTALVRLLYQQGDRDGAVAVSRDALATGCAQIDCDPWWRYPRSQLRSFDALLLDLRAEARR